MKRIAYFVVGVHLTLFCCLAWLSPKAKPKKEPLIVKTVMAPAPKPAAPVEKQQVVAAAAPVPQKKQAPKKNPVPKKVVATKKPVKKKGKAPKVSKELARKLEQSLAKLDSVPVHSPSIKPLKAAKRISTLAVEKGGGGDADAYVEHLVDCLQSRLNLPEQGRVKVSLTLQSKGQFVRMDVLESGNLRNRNFLEGALKKVSYPRFSGTLAKEKEHTFVITFYNQ